MRTRTPFTPGFRHASSGFRPVPQIPTTASVSLPQLPHSSYSLCIAPPACLVSYPISPANLKPMRHARIASVTCSDSLIFLRKDHKDACSETNPAGCHGINYRPSVRILACECPAMALGWTAERRRSSVCCRHSRSITGKKQPRQPLFDTAVEPPGPAGTNQTSCEDLLRKHFSTEGDGILHTDTIDDFIVKSRVGGPLSKTFETDLPHSFVAASAFSREKVKNLSDGYQPFYELFPGADGILALTHVGFNHDMTEALVSSSLFCSGLCGNGQTHVLRKRWGKWVVVMSPTDWVS